MLSCRSAIRWIPARALGALDPRERDLLDAHLADCGECRRELATYRLLADGMALVGRGAEPSPRLRRRVMAEALDAPTAGAVVSVTSRPA